MLEADWKVEQLAIAECRLKHRGIALWPAFVMEALERSGAEIQPSQGVSEPPADFLASLQVAAERGQGSIGDECEGRAKAGEGSIVVRFAADNRHR